jgi:hypothetical protein
MFLNRMKELGAYQGQLLTYEQEQTKFLSP